MALDGINPLDPKVLTGSDASVFMDGKPLLFLTDLSPDWNYNQQEIRAIGSWFAKGTRSVKFTGTFSATAHLITTEEDGLPRLPQMEEILTAPPLVVEVREKSSGVRIMRFTAKLNTEGVNLSSDTLSGRRLSFVLIQVQLLEGFH